MEKNYMTIEQMEQLKAEYEGMKHNLTTLVWRITESQKWYHVVLEPYGSPEELGSWQTSDWSDIKDFCATHDNYGDPIYGLGLTEESLYQLTQEYIKAKKAEGDKDE